MGLGEQIAYGSRPEIDVDTVNMLLELGTVESSLELAEQVGEYYSAEYSFEPNGSISFDLTQKDLGIKSIRELAQASHDPY